MRVCFDTNTFIRIFSPASAFVFLRRALIRGELTLLISNEILLEYREVIERQSQYVTWSKFEEFLNTLQELHGNVVEVSPQFRFNTISVDPDDNKFADCAITADGEFIVTYDQHFRLLDRWAA